MHVASDKQNIQSSDWPKWHCELWRYITSRLFKWPNVISDGPTNRLPINQLKNTFPVQSTYMNAGAQLYSTYMNAGAQHDVLRDEVNLGLHLHLLPVQRDEQHTEVRATEVQGQEITLLWQHIHITVNTGLPWTHYSQYRSSMNTLQSIQVFHEHITVNTGLPWKGKKVFPRAWYKTIVTTLFSITSYTSFCSKPLKYYIRFLTEHFFLQDRLTLKAKNHWPK